MPTMPIQWEFNEIRCEAIFTGFIGKSRIFKQQIDFEDSKKLHKTIAIAWWMMVCLPLSMCTRLF